MFLICGPKRPIHFLKINIQKFVLLRYNGHQATSIATLGAFPVFPSLSERPEKFRLLVAHLINLKIYECDFVITFFFLIQMNFGLIVNLDLKRALFPRRLEKYRKLPVSTNPLKLFHSIWHYVKPNRLCPVTTIVCFTMSLIMLNFINFLFQCQYKFYLDFYLFFLLLK